MMKTDKKSIINKMIKQNKLSKNQAKIAQLIQSLYKDDSLMGRMSDSSQKIYIDNSTPLSGDMEKQFNGEKSAKKAVFSLWKQQILSGKLDPLVYHICYNPNFV